MCHSGSYFCQILSNMHNDQSDSLDLGSVFTVGFSLRDCMLKSEFVTDETRKSRVRLHLNRHCQHM